MASTEAEASAEAPPEEARAAPAAEGEEEDDLYGAFEPQKQADDDDDDEEEEDDDDDDDDDDEDDDEDESSEDDLDVVLDGGGVQSHPSVRLTTNQYVRGPEQQDAVGAAAAAPLALPKPNEGMYELDIETLEQKPWRKAGADISDYFNYGFDERTWAEYCKKQVDIRLSLNKSANPSDYRATQCAQAPRSTSSRPVGRQTRAVGRGRGRRAGPARTVATTAVAARGPATATTADAATQGRASGSEDN